MSRILIAGCGYVGAALAARLAKNGNEVWGMRLNSEALPNGVQALQADLTNPETLSRLPGDLDYVFYTAGASEFSEAAYKAAYVLGMRNLLAALQSQAQQPKRVIFTSSTGVYAQQDGQWVDEESPAEPTSFSGKAVLEGEGLLQASPFETIALRLGGIYGPGRTRLIDRVRKGEAPIEASPRHLNLIHLDDIVGALMHLMLLEAAGPVYIGVDSDPQEWNEFIRWIAHQLGVPEPSSNTQAPPRRPPRNRRCSNARLRSTGYAFRYPSCRTAYRKLIQSTS
ncbi:MAG: SDR family oxidoreductase [Candidatus Hydrogenedentes bacterium]|nr:SDR family oxidoreductase [Candidatus Hydrogenedentota bacterium]